MTRSQTVLLTAFFFVSGARAAGVAGPPAPAIRIYVYSSSDVRASLLEYSESEAARILRPAQLRLEWINCLPEASVQPCLSPHFPGEMILRLVPKAWPEVKPNVFGFADSSSGRPAAFVFYDRALSLQGANRFLFIILGRILAHEITHLLLPQEGHRSQGLMRARWTTSDLDFSNTDQLRLSARAIQLMHTQASRGTDAH
ncbi:MAG TPA: hypothetical protein VKX25_10815 [Bryobacteraceae bacterium]|jgi:hypothetical protein|nr:hypothetical protein [Bryobacteraceae bacterium]